MSTTESIVTADGLPLKASLARATRRGKIRAITLVVPLFLFILFTFFLPIADMLTRSVRNDVVVNIMPNTTKAIANWDHLSNEAPGEEVFEALAKDFNVGSKNKTIGKVGLRLNYEKSGFSGLYRKTARKIKKNPIVAPPYKEAFLKLDKKWAKVDFWRIYKRESGNFTKAYYLAAVDAGYDEDGKVVMNDATSQIYLDLFWRTVWVSTLITFLCIILAYPVSYLLSVLPSKKSNLLLILVLLPFWTSLLVRTTAWIALLQQEGIINDILVWFGFFATDDRLAMIHNRAGTIIAMTHILLPFMILPLYSVMKTIPPSYMRAARSLGATPFTAFVRIYLPNTVSGVGAGVILVFILSIGFYITPALVGGTSGTLISNFIAYHLGVSLNWGLAAALGAILLALVLILYYVYDKIVGIDNMKLG